jgi:iron complex outermembrane recepter protein
VRKNKRSSVALVKKSSIVATEIALACMSVQFAYAQQQAAAERVERVEITGTRLPAISTEGPSPVAVMNAEEIRMDGLAKPEDLLKNLPQVFDSQNTSQANGATGTAQVNLRNLGADRNLVLVNGRRLPPGSPRQGGYAADLNQIPTPLIQRVDLLTGGASAVYGSDAISGVVNFILNDRFEGVQLDYYHSFAQHEQQQEAIQQVVAGRAATNPTQFQVPGDVESDGRINGLSMLMGKNFADNKGNATVFFHYKKESAVRQRERDFSACALDPDAAGTGFACGGSSTAFPGRFLLPGATGVATGANRTVADSAGTTRAFSAATDQFNFGPYNYYRRPSTQYGANAFLNFDIHPQVRLYSELGFHDNRTNAVIAPSGIFFGVPFTIFAENPLLSADWRAQIAAANAACAAAPGAANCVTSGAATAGFAAPTDFSTLLIGRRNIEGGGRDDDIRHTSTRGVVGAKGDFAKHWNYDVFAQAGNVYYQSVYRNEFSTLRTTRALDVVTDPATGQPACRSFVDGTDPNCVPYNLWSLGGVTPGALNYIQVNGVRNGDTHQDVFGASVRTDLGNYGLKLPSAKNGVGFVLGIERRRESLRSEPDALFESNDLAGQGGATIGVQGELGVREIFTEFGIPIIEGRPFADLLSVILSYRYSDYTTDKTTNTYGIGAEWAPTKTIKTRGSYQHAVRHANITELFLGQGTNLFDMDADPCGATPTHTAAQCAQTGLVGPLAGAYGSSLLDSPAGQYQFLQGGTPTLNPEKADTYTFGLVLTPARDFSATIDYWNIKIDDAIDAPTPSALLTGCLNTGANCNLIQRDPVTGVLWFGGGRVVALNSNIGGYHTDGVDLALNYLLRLGGLGSFGLNFAGSWLHKWEFEPIKGAGRFDCVGFYGANCSFNRGPLPEWRHKFRVSWAMPWNLDVAATWRHIHKVDHETTSSDPDIAGTTAQVNKTLGARDYLDLALAWNITKVFSLRAGVNNVLDKDPPIVTQGVSGPSVLGNGNTFPGTYDALGRVFFFNVGMKL